MNGRHLYRRIVSLVMMTSTFLAALIALIPLFLILAHLVNKGIGAINLDFLTHLPQPVGETGGGMANAIVGTLILIGLACSIALPIGIMGGIYLAEFGKNKLGFIVRFTADMLNGTPSIVIGIFVYGLIVIRMGHFSTLAGGIALGILMIPMIMRNTEEMLKLVPSSLKEAALALGLPYWKTLSHVVLKTARNGIITGILLAIARIAGETAPLLFTSLGNQFWNTRLDEPIAALPLQIFTYAISPFEDWQRQAWAGALVLIGIILFFNVGSRVIIRNRLARRR